MQTLIRNAEAGHGGVDASVGTVRDGVAQSAGRVDVDLLTAGDYDAEGEGIVAADEEGVGLV